MRVRRIVAGLHPRRHPGDGLQEIAELARSMEAELLGLFIEDTVLLHFAGLPFTREIGAASGLQREIDVAAMERLMRVRAEELRGRLADALGASAVPWSFRVARGTLAQQLLAAAIEQPGPTLLLPPGSDIDEEPCIVPLAELTHERLSELLERARPILILPPEP